MARKVGNIGFAHIETRTHQARDWIVKPPADTKPEDLLVPEYWKHVVQQKGIRPMDEITAWCADGVWVADYRVIHTGPEHAKLVLKGDVTYLDEVKDTDLETSTMIVKWISPATRYGVRRKSDNHTLQDGFATKADAVRWMHSNERVAA